LLAIQALFDTMLDPKHIDYWWTDYKGCDAPTKGQYPIPQTNGCPKAKQQSTSGSEMLWSNMIYDNMISRTGKRPMVLSRYGGIGNQRYGIGFSGDTESAWPTLKYQVEMTPTAANVLQAYWSHDIGMHTLAACPYAHSRSPCTLSLHALFELCVAYSVSPSNSVGGYNVSGLQVQSAAINNSSTY
jgi:hypothetical protein